MELNQDVLELIIYNLNAADADAYELHDFMATSKQIYEMTSAWRKKYCSFGNIIMKPYQEEFWKNMTPDELFYFEEEADLMRLLCANYYLHGDYYTIIPVVDANKWRQIVATYGVEHLCEFLSMKDYKLNTGEVSKISIEADNYEELILEVKYRSCINTFRNIDDSEPKIIIVSDINVDILEVFDIYMDRFTIVNADYELKAGHITGDINKANRVLIKRDAVYAPIIKEHFVYDFDFSALSNLIKKIGAHEIKVIRVNAKQAAANNGYVINDKYIRIIEYECDPNRRPPSKKTIYYDNDKLRVDNIIVLNYYCQWFEGGNRFPRTINVYYLYDSLFGRFGSQHGFRAIYNEDMILSFIRLAGIEFHTLTRDDVDLLFGKATRDTRYEIWCRSKTTTLSDSQVRAYLGM